MFGGKASEKKVKVLSGGERSRLAMIRLLLQPVNLLILDEPTNHLDMQSKEVLKEAIADFDGTVIVVSHDRYFLDGLVEKVYEFSNHHVREHLGGIYDFLQHKQLGSLQELEVKERVASETPEQRQPSQGRLNYEEQKERERRVKQAERQVKRHEEEIARIEKEIAGIEEQLQQGGTVPADIYERHGALNAQLEQVMQQWESANELLDSLRQQG